MPWLFDSQPEPCQPYYDETGFIIHTLLHCHVLSLLLLFFNLRPYQMERIWVQLGPFGRVLGKASDFTVHKRVMGSSSPGWDHLSLGWKYHSKAGLHGPAHASYQRS